MRISIKQCKICNINPKECDYKRHLHSGFVQLPFLKDKVFSHNCMQFKKLFVAGDRVNARLFLYEKNDYNSKQLTDMLLNDTIDSIKFSNWIELQNSPFIGTITGKFYKNKFWEIQLDDESVALTYKQNVSNRNTDFDDVPTIVQIAKYINKI